MYILHLSDYLHTLTYTRILCVIMCVNLRVYLDLMKSSEPKLFSYLQKINE